ncbi:MAG: Amuc_1100 family pilus-like protein [Verrucomicrobia bacterium]|nr:Amuc_1100 family pilus-like protein [Verrucomicrobiota bacterium]
MNLNLGKNKFYVGLGAVLLLGCLILGGLLFQASSEFGEAEQKYNAQVAELNRLQKLDLYPEVQNQKILEDQMAAAKQAAVSLHRQLVPMAFALEPMTPEQFQDKLNAAVKNLGEKAANAGVNLSDKLYLGFSEYRTATPKPEAAAALGRQLKCIELAVDTMIERKIASVEKITRTLLPEEQDAKAAAPTPKPKQAGGKQPATELLAAYPFEIQFSAEQRAFQSVLNELSKNTQQFFIITPVAIKNQSEKGPKKIAPAAAAEIAKSAAEAAKAAPGDVAAPKTEKLRYVLGAEKLNVTLRLDAVVFASNLPK